MPTQCAADPSGDSARVARLSADFGAARPVSRITAHHALDELAQFVTGHGISGNSRIHFLKLPGTTKGGALATAMRTSDIIMAALDSYVENVAESRLVIVNTCYAGQIAAELQTLHTDDRARAAARWPARCPGHLRPRPAGACRT
ncbi:hypothetical protein [Streptomyces lydicus]|uniref:hypothetical protein n=1 Tax=Streptomyces lydicus TaxID=47763 RepID=UPI00331DC4E8